MSGTLTLLRKDTFFSYMGKFLLCVFVGVGLFVDEMEQPVLYEPYQNNHQQNREHFIHPALTPTFYSECSDTPRGHIEGLSDRDIGPGYGYEDFDVIDDF